jgi:hypothetical protein
VARDVDRGAATKINQMRRPLWSGAETRSECAGQRQAGWPQGAAPGRPALVPWGASVACAAWIPPCYSLRYVQLFWGRPGRGRPDDVYLPGLYRFRPRKRKRRILLILLLTALENPSTAPPAEVHANAAWCARETPRTCLAASAPGWTTWWGMPIVFELAA